MGFIELHGTYVGLQRIHRLILLLIKYSAKQTMINRQLMKLFEILHLPDGAPCVRVSLALLDRIAIGYKGVVDFVDPGKAPSQ